MITKQEIERLINSLPSEVIERVGAESGVCKIEMMPKPFEDSTHQIIKVFFDNNPLPYVLKCCPSVQETKLSQFLIHSNHAVPVAETAVNFWLRMTQLFDLRPCQTLLHAESVYQWMQKLSPFYIPDLYAQAEIKASSIKSFTLQEYIEGNSCQNRSVDQLQLDLLTNHLLSLHQYETKGFGPGFIYRECPELLKDQDVWFKRLKSIILGLSIEYVPVSDRNKAIECLDELVLQPQKFVPQLIDFRWDQVHVRYSKAITENYLLDLDALVLAPIELDWVMLEMVLSEPQFRYLVEKYRQQCPIPDISRHRLAYRMLLFAMNILGESDWEKWKNAPFKLVE